jgi:hypothetical protein
VQTNLPIFESQQAKIEENSFYINVLGGSTEVGPLLDKSLKPDLRPVRQKRKDGR